MLYFGKPISGKVAEEIGLVNKVVPAGQVLTEAYAWAKELAQKPSLSKYRYKATTQIHKRSKTSKLARRINQRFTQPRA